MKRQLMFGTMSSAALAVAVSAQSGAQTSGSRAGPEAVKTVDNR